MNKNILLSVVILLAVLSSCNELFNRKTTNKVIAVAAGNELLYSQLVMATPRGMNEIDSISFVQNYIEKWVKNNLLLEKAELNLDNHTLNEIELMIDNYKTSLMVFQYQQMLVQQKLDTIITEENIEDYYADNAGNFKLDSSVVKAVFVKLPKALHNSYNVRQWIRSNREEDLISLEDYCYQHARNFDMGENWISFSDLLRFIPRKVNDQEAFLKYNRFFESQDSLYRYYVGIIDYKLSYDTTPIDFVKPQIRNIILNRRKMKFINDLENNIYRDAVNQKRFTIYAN